MEAYDRTGHPISLRAWEELWCDPAYEIVKQTVLPGKRKWVSTIWVGLSPDGASQGLPLIFETMVFGVKDLIPNPALEEAQRGTPRRFQQCYGQWRWRTEAQARQGHEDVCREWRQNRRQRRRSLDTRREGTDREGRPGDSKGRHANG